MVGFSSDTCWTKKSMDCMWVLFFTAFAPKCKVIRERDTKSHARHIPFSEPTHTQKLTKDSHNTGNFLLCSFRIVCGSFNVPQWSYVNMEGICETGPTEYRSYPRRLESLTICWFNYKGITLFSVRNPVTVEVVLSLFSVQNSVLSSESFVQQCLPNE